MDIKITEAVKSSFQNVSNEKFALSVLLVGSSIVVFSGVYYLIRKKKGKKVPGTLDISGGHIENKKLKEAFNSYRLKLIFIKIKYC